LTRHIVICKLEGKTEEGRAFLNDRGDVWEIFYHTYMEDGSFAMLNEKNAHHKRWGKFNEKNFKIIEIYDVQT